MVPVSSEKSEECAAWEGASGGVVEGHLALGCRCFKVRVEHGVVYWTTLLAVLAVHLAGLTCLFHTAACLAHEVNTLF